MKSLFLPNHPAIEIHLKANARAKRLTLRISRLDKKVTLSAPPLTPTRDIFDFVAAHEQWIMRHLDTMPDMPQITFGAAIPILGQDMQIVLGSEKRVQLHDGQILVPKTTTDPRRVIKTYLRLKAREELAQASDFYAKKLGKPYHKLTIRDTRSRWGSCSSKGFLMYSWRLIMAPRPVLNYVAAHEVAHLDQMNHSQKFWDVVSRLYGEYEQPRAWLKKHGNRLHSFDFGN